MKVKIVKSEYKDVAIGNVFSVVNAYESMKVTNYLVYQFTKDTIGFLNLETCKSDYRISSDSDIEYFAAQTIASDLNATEVHWFSGDSEVELILKGR